MSLHRRCRPRPAGTPTVRPCEAARKTPGREGGAHKPDIECLIRAADEGRLKIDVVALPPVLEFLALIADYGVKADNADIMEPHRGLWRTPDMIEFRALPDDHPDLAYSPLLRGALLTLQDAQKHGLSIPDQNGASARRDTGPWRWVRHAPWRTWPPHA